MMKSVVFTAVLVLSFLTNTVYAGMPQIVDEATLSATPVKAEKNNDFQLVDDEDFSNNNDDSNSQDDPTATADDEPDTTAEAAHQGPVANQPAQQSSSNVNNAPSPTDEPQVDEEDGDSLNQTSQNEPHYYYD